MDQVVGVGKVRKRFGREVVVYPTKLFMFGARPPVEGMDAVNDQMKLARVYRNNLAEEEIQRRKEVDALLLDLSPELAKVETDLAKAKGDQKAFRQGIRDERAEVRSMVPMSPEGADEAKRHEAAVKALENKRESLRNALFKTEEFNKRNAPIEAASKERKLALRASSGLSWGTYLHVEDSMKNRRKGPPPKFHRWDGHGHLAVQIMKGMPVPNAFAGKSNFLRIEPVPDEAWMPGGRKLRRTRAYFRVKSDGKRPVWAVVPFVLHRPMPADGEIKWVHLIRERVGVSFRWKIMFAVARRTGWPKSDAAATGMVGIDVGWRLMDEEKVIREKPYKPLRVAVWVDNFGRQGELSLSADWMAEMRRTESIQSTRDKNFNAAKKRLWDWEGSRSGQLAEDLKWLPLWKSPDKLVKVVSKWRHNRILGDEEIFAEMDAWRRRERHLRQFQDNLRDQLQAKRLNIYREFACRMRRQYKVVVMEHLDLRDFHKLVPDEYKEMDEKWISDRARDACLSELIRCMKESML